MKSQDKLALDLPTSARDEWLRVLEHCHSALTAYGAQRLESAGWRDLGIGSLSVASAGFRALACEIAIGWATYEARDSWGQTIAEIALRQPHWFSPGYHDCIGVLAKSRLDLYRVQNDGGPHTRLRRMSDGAVFAVTTPSGCVTPAGATVVARLACDVQESVVLASAVIAPEAALGVVQRSEVSDPDSWSRSLLEALLRQFSAVDIDGRGTRLEARLVETPLRKIARLHRALRALELVLEASGGEVARHQAADGRRLLAERRGQHWRVVLSGARPASVERVPVAASHPVDAELMRQIGARERDGVLSVEGPIDDLVSLCAGAAVARSAQAA